MEKLGGGGHLAMAATQIEEVSVEEAEQQVVEILQENQKEEE